MTNQYVTISVTEGENTLTITREKLYEWTNAPTPHISVLIDAAAEDAKAMIADAERVAEPF